MSRRWAQSLAAVIAAFVLLACGQVATARAADAGANRTAAQAEATRLLSSVQLPPGATSSPGEPAGDHADLARISYAEATPNLVDAPGWWTTSTSPDAVLAYVREHRPAGASPWSSTASGGPYDTQFASFMLPPIPGVLSQRVVGVTVTRLQNGLTGIRVDGLAIWIVPRPAWEQIPSTVRTVTFTARGSDQFGRPGRESAPVLLRAPQVGSLVNFINRLPIVQPGIRACPAARFGWVRMTFRAADGSVLAHATEQPTGCPFVALTVGGRSGPALDDYPTVTGELIRLRAFPACAGRSLSAASGAPGFVPSGQALSFVFTNRSRAVCQLQGFARLRAFDARGRRVALTVRRTAGGGPIVLDPGEAASTLVRWRQCRSTRVSRLRVTVPGVRPAFTVRPGSGTQSFAPCHGRVTVSPLMLVF